MKPLTETNSIELDCSVLLGVDTEYVWYNVKRDEIKSFSYCGHLILSGYSFTVNHIVFLGNL